ncbi:hypothetical protein KM043_004216 [Ampulex compressa]|nr:hypothetical protein KM043_004216 [Ampulex compressa]
MECLRKFLRTVKAKSLRSQKQNLFHERRIFPIQKTSNRLKHTSNNVYESLDDENEKQEFMNLRTTYIGNIMVGHRVFIIQPYIKWGKDKKTNTTPELQLEEAVALVNTLPNWSVANQVCVPLLTLQKQQLVGSGTLKSLQDQIKNTHNVTAIFVSTNLLKFIQIIELQKVFGLPIYDRYTLVVNIFRQHAKTPEAKLQVALAEIPYMRKKMLDLRDCGRINLTERNRMILERREKKLKNALLKLGKHRDLIRKQRKVQDYPTVAVVGYTNAGKTSLIKALTNDAALQPENKLFATLDTTVHEGILPSKLRVLYVDTIGFIQDVPQTLIAPFTVTLEDAMIADVIVHVYDVSHPDMRAQIQHVEETIKPMMEKNQIVISAANKCDLLPNDSIPTDAIVVSATKLTGIDVLRMRIEKEVLASTGRKRMCIRVESGSSAAAWLYKQTAVTGASEDPNDPQFLILEVIATPLALTKFKQFLKQ